jgi:hypothetical protein
MGSQAPQAHQQVGDLEGDEGHHCSPHKHHADGLRLNDELLHDRAVARLHLEPVVVEAGPAEAWRIEDARHQRAEYTAHGVNTEHIERVIRLQHFLQTGDAPQAQHSHSQADHECARDAHVARRRRNCNQTGNGA